MKDLYTAIVEQAQAAKRAEKILARMTTEEKNRALAAMARSLEEEKEPILQANQRDVQAARQAGLPEAKIDRLLLNEKRIRDMVEGLHAVARLNDPVGEVDETWTRPNGLLLQKVRVPFGLVAIIYESRPNVTVDAAGLCLKTGNAVILRGGKEALHSNLALVRALQKGLAAAGFPEQAVQLVERTEREAVDILIQLKDYVDLVIPRGGAGLIQRVVRNSVVPVIETGVGNCHIYVDQQADLAMATRIIVNAKTQRPSVCNAMETLLVHQAVAHRWLPEITAELRKAGVEVRGCERTRQVVGDLVAASEEDWETEYLDLILAVKVVDSLEEAIEHIDRYGTKHSEAIVTEDKAAAETFLRAVDAAAVYHNASTRFTDGFEYGFGAEIGISTQKMHARGPMGLRELTSYKYIGRGSGQIRV
jgi:glutamate-5-semialdehyde dehydrogenase